MHELLAEESEILYSLAMPMHRIAPGKNVPEEIHVFVEIPKGSQNKYEWDEELNVLRLDRVLFSPMVYPGDYGFIPQTLGFDNDPLDALVFVTNATYPATIIDARPIGVLEIIDDGEEDDKILCVPVHDVRFNHMNNIDDIEEPFLNEIAHFFTVYKELEGKKVEVKGWKDAAEAKKIIERCVEAYKKKGM